MVVENQDIYAYNIYKWKHKGLLGYGYFRLVQEVPVDHLGKADISQIIVYLLRGVLDERK